MKPVVYNKKPARFIAPGKLAKEHGFAQKSSKPARESSGENVSVHKSTGGTQRPQVEEREPQYNSNRRIFGGISAHTLTMNFGEEKLIEKDFTEDSCFLDILNMCKKFIDIYSVGFKIRNGDGYPLRNDRDVLLMLKDHEGVENIDIYVDLDQSAQPLLFKMPQDNPTFSVSMSEVPKVTDVMILGGYKTNEKVIVRGNVINGTENASTVQFFFTNSRNFDVEAGLRAISDCTVIKEFQIPIEAMGHYLVAKFTPMTEDGESGQPGYAISEQHVEGPTPDQVKRSVRGKNKNKKVATLKRGEKLEIEFYNNRAVGDNHRYWSRHLGKIVRNKHICPVQVKTWKEVTGFEKHHMWDSVKECFSNPNIDLYREHTLDHMGELWAAWRSSLYVAHVKPCKTKSEVLKNVPQGMNGKDWEWLVNNKFLSDDFQEVSNQNSNNRVKGVMPHRTGRKPHRHLIYELENNPPDVAKIFFETRQKGGKIIEPEVQAKYNEIENIVKEKASLSHLEVVEKCIGPQRHSHVFGLGGGMKRKHLNDSQTTYIKELEAKLHEKNEENTVLKRRMDGIESRLARIESDTEPKSHVPPTSSNEIE